MSEKFIFIKRVIVRDEYYVVKVSDDVINNADGKGSVIERVMESNFCYDTTPFDTDVHRDEFEMSTTVPTITEIQHAEKYDDFLDLTTND